MEYLQDYEDLNSQKSKNLIAILKREISDLCRRADSQNFKGVNILKLKKGSVMAESIAEYSYPNNNSQMIFLNQELGPALERIFNDSNSLGNLSVALGNVSIQNTEIIMQAVEISNISDLQSFVRCSVDFANFTKVIVNGKWVCVGPCQTNVNFCSEHGKCFNEINGPNCQCDRSNFEEFYGSQCELYRRRAGFYGVLFGSLAAFVLLLIVVIVIFVVLYRGRRTSSKRKLSSIFGDVFFDFTARGDNYNLHKNVSLSEETVSGIYRPYQENAPVRPEPQDVRMSNE
ncbi:mucin-12 isoform X2 [Triplophysa dalaica]|uniref:mucin-12 isoform X2 n=1 Tax=Triplophysa dalaica TaxID=1582913 RepID=UPI0024DF36AB|nr:mucin-12 isoform X2 [Triplophysa dalaica]